MVGGEFYSQFGSCSHCSFKYIGRLLQQLLAGLMSLADGSCDVCDGSNVC